MNPPDAIPGREPGDPPGTPENSMNSPRLADLFHSTPEERLRPILDRLFPEETEDLIAAFRRLRVMEADPKIELELRLDRDGDEVFVGGTDPKTGEAYALDLMPWIAYLGLTVPPALLDAFTAEEILAHVLCEMTFYGATEDSATETLKEILRLKRD